MSSNSNTNSTSGSQTSGSSTSSTSVPSFLRSFRPPRPLLSPSTSIGNAASSSSAPTQSSSSSISSTSGNSSVPAPATGPTESVPSFADCFREDQLSTWDHYFIRPPSPDPLNINARRAAQQRIHRREEKEKQGVKPAGRGTSGFIRITNLPSLARYNAASKSLSPTPALLSMLERNLSGSVSTTVAQSAASVPLSTTSSANITSSCLPPAASTASQLLSLSISPSTSSSSSTLSSGVTQTAIGFRSGSMHSCSISSTVPSTISSSSSSSSVNPTVDLGTFEYDDDDYWNSLSKEEREQLEAVTPSHTEVADNKQSSPIDASKTQTSITSDQPQGLTSMLKLTVRLCRIAAFQYNQKRRRIQILQKVVLPDLTRRLEKKAVVKTLRIGASLQLPQCVPRSIQQEFDQVKEEAQLNLMRIMIKGREAELKALTAKVEKSDVPG